AAPHLGEPGPGRAARARGLTAAARAALGGRCEPGVLQGERGSRFRGAVDGGGSARPGGVKAGVARYLIGMTGASGAIDGVDFVRRCPGEKYLVLSDWARQVLHTETGLKPTDLEPHVQRIYSDTDLAAPFSSGSNRHDGLVIVPCSVSTLAKIAA